jgi:DNA-binding NarL/FixJ family response regulator
VSETSVGRAPLRVVLCDDAAEMRALLRWALERADRPVTVVGEAADADQAVDLIARERPDVAVIDLQMPGASPDALLRAITEAAPGVPMVTFSGFEPDLVAPSEAHLVTLHIPKTTDLAVVREAIIGAANAPADG